MSFATSTFSFSHASDAAFRTWGSAVSALLAAAGLVQTADTGQINWATVTRPGGAATAAGYEIWRFNDALQATRPIFIKVEYGNGGNTTMPQVWVTVGSATDGAGTLSAAAGLGGAVSTRYDLGYTSTISWMTNTVASRVNLASDGAEVYALLGLGASTTRAHGFMFHVTRTRDNDGTPNGDGWVFNMSAGGMGFAANTQATRAEQRHFFGSRLPQPSAKFGGGLVIAASVWWTQTGAATGVRGANTYLIPCCSGLMHRLYGPSKLLMGCFKADTTLNQAVTAPDAFGDSHAWIGAADTMGSCNIAGDTQYAYIFRAD